MRQKWSIFKALLLICTKNLLFWLEHYACLGSNGFQDLFGTKNYGFSILVQSYVFCSLLKKSDILDFTLSHALVKATKKLYDWKEFIFRNLRNIIWRLKTFDAPCKSSNLRYKLDGTRIFSLSVLLFNFSQILTLSPQLKIHYFL